MNGRAFLDLASELVNGKTEAHWRGAAGRAYYGLLLEGRDCLGRWGFAPPPRDQVHAFVRLRFSYATEPDLKQIGMTLDYLIQLRNRADYELASVSFSSNTRALRALSDARRALAVLDALDGDNTRRLGAIAAVRKAWP
jgi:hypothetical protein